MIVERHSDIRRRHILRALPICVLLLLLSAKSIWALDPAQPANYIRARFAAEEGLPSNLVDDLVQSQDGFLWLRVNGSDLARFDGRHFDQFGGGEVLSLAIAPDGNLWVGTADGLKQIPASALKQIARLPATSFHPGPDRSNQIVALRFTRNGVLWVGTRGGLYKFEHGVFSLAIPESFVERIEEMANGHLWVRTTRGPLEWDGSRVVPHPELEAQLGVKAIDIFQIFEDSHGVTWYCTKSGVARRIGGTIEKLGPYGSQGHHEAFRVYEDPHGRMWLARGEGLYRATTAGLELVAADMNVRFMYGDRDGNLWVGTNGDGLFRFKDRAVRMFTTANGLPNNVVMTVLATHDGTLWAGFNCGGLARFDGNAFRIYNEKDGLLNTCVWALAEDANHDLWVGTWGGGVFRLHDGRFTQYSKAQGLPGNVVLSIAVAQDGSLWLVGSGKRVSRMRADQVRNYTAADGLFPALHRKVYADRAGGIWVQSLKGAARLAGDRFASSAFLANVELGPIGEDRAGGLYFLVGSPRGIFRVANNQTIQVASDFVAEELRETDQGDLWLLSIDGIFRVPPGGLDHARPRDEPLDLEAFGLADGMTTTQPSAGDPASALTPDGKLWIATNQGLAMLDLPRMPRADHKPAIYIEKVMVGRDTQPPGNELALPAGTHHLELNMDAIEISSPEKIHLQYRMDGVDSEWLDANPPGRAVYSNIPPGIHAFHVRSCNGNGIWDRAGMVYYVTQEPYFYQTRWFLAAMITFSLLVIAGLYQLRMRQMARSLGARFEERLAERNRIARELHDTLLQSFNGVLLRFQSVSNLLPARPEEAKQRVDAAIDQTANAIAEGRDAVQKLRSGELLATSDLAQAIGILSKELVGDSTVAVHVQVAGKERNLNPMVRDEVYRISAEALRNAITHAGAGRIEVEVHYDEQQLRISIRDDGKGIDPDVLERGYAPGHWACAACENAPGLRVVI